MADSIRYIDDREGNHVYPVTHERAVMDSSGVKLETKLGLTNTQLGNISDTLISMQNSINSLSSDAYVVSWDGESFPMANRIPSAATVIYQSVPTDGTLLPSENTLGRIFLVSNGQGEFIRYATSYGGALYTWVNMGTTSIDLSDYVRKDSEVWLTEDQFNAIAVKDSNIIYNVYEESVTI